MGEHGPKAARPHAEQVHVELERPAVVGELQQQRAGAAERQAAQLLRVEARRQRERQLAAADDLDRDALLGHGRPQLADELLDRVGAGRVVAADVRRRREHAHAVRGRGPDDREAVRGRDGAVVDARQDVGVEIDHGGAGDDTPRRGLSSLDVQDLELERAARGRHLDDLALLLAQDRLADGRLVRELALRRVRLRRADDVVLNGLVRVHVLQLHVRADRDDVLGDLLLVDHARVEEALLELGDPVLEHRLLVLGVVVLRVLGDVAELARLLDALGNLATLLGREVVDLLLELLVALCSEDYVLHVRRPPGPKKEQCAAHRRRRGREGYLRVWTDVKTRELRCPRARRTTHALADRERRDPDARRARADGGRQRAGVPATGPALRRGARLLGDGLLRRDRAPQRADARLPACGLRRAPAR